jgi:hypothetical protein
VVIEQEQRVIADRLEVAVVGTPFLLPMHRALAVVHVEHDAVGVWSSVSACPITARFTAISPTRFSSRVSSSVSNQCSVDVSAALRSHSFGDPISRNVGSVERRAASLRSS